MVGGKQDKYEPSKKVIVTTDAVAMASGVGLLVLKADGMVECYRGSSSSSLKIPSDYRLFDSYDSYINQKNDAEKMQAQKLRQQKSYREAGVCQYCGGTFKKSFFGSKCT